MSDKAKKWEVMHSSANNNWCTPKWLYERLDREHKFNLDPTATAKSAKAKYYFTPDQDCLKQEWSMVTGPAGGEVRAYMNPPYGLPEAACAKRCKKKKCVKRGHHTDKYIPGQIDFVKKAIAESRSGVKVVCLIPARTDTAIFQELLLGQYYVEIQFIAGRITFEDEDGNPARDANGNPAPCPFPLMIVILHPHPMADVPAANRRPFQVGRFEPGAY
jgi:phage N-6-adenine-methyltransferase